MTFSQESCLLQQISQSVYISQEKGTVYGWYSLLESLPQIPINTSFTFSLGQWTSPLLPICFTLFFHSHLQNLHVTLTPYFISLPSPKWQPSILYILMIFWGKALTRLMNLAIPCMGIFRRKFLFS